MSLVSVVTLAFMGLNVVSIGLNLWSMRRLETSRRNLLEHDLKEPVALDSVLLDSIQERAQAAGKPWRKYIEDLLRADLH